MPKMSEKASVEAIIQPGIPSPSLFRCPGSVAAMSADIWRALMPRINVSSRARTPRTSGQRRRRPL